MNDNQLLDDLRDKPVAPQRFRVLAFLLEIAPVFLMVLNGLAGGNAVFFLILIIPANYLFFSWYFFKASKYKREDILVAELAGLSIVFGFLAFLFKLESWPGAQTFFYIVHLIQTPLLIYLLWRYTKNRLSDPLEYRFSLKLGIRIILFSWLLLELQGIGPMALL